MKLTLAILLVASACLALDQPRYPMAHIAAKNATYELIPTRVPMPTGQSQVVTVWKRMVTATTATNPPPVLDTNSPTVPQNLVATAVVVRNPAQLLFCYPHDGSADGFRIYTRTSFAAPWTVFATLPADARCYLITNDWTLFRMFTVTATNSVGEAPPISRTLSFPETQIPSRAPRTQ